MNSENCLKGVDPDHQYMAPSSIACNGMFHSYFMIAVAHCMLEKNQLNLDIIIIIIY